MPISLEAAETSDEASAKTSASNTYEVRRESCILDFQSRRQTSFSTNYCSTATGASNASNASNISLRLAMVGLANELQQIC